MSQEVTEKKLEIGSMATNVILFLILGVMGWVGLNIEKLNNSMTTVIVATSNNAIRIDNTNSRLDQHIYEKHKTHAAN